MTNDIQKRSRNGKVTILIVSIPMVLIAIIYLPLFIYSSPLNEYGYFIPMGDNWDGEDTVFIHFNSGTYSSKILIDETLYIENKTFTPIQTQQWKYTTLTNKKYETVSEITLKNGSFSLEEKMVDKSTGDYFGNASVHFIKIDNPFVVYYFKYIELCY